MARISALKYREDVMKALELIQAGTPLICFDTETTGISYKTDRILSLSAIKIVMTDGIPQETDRIDFFMNPGFPIPEKASQVNHIYDADVKDKPTEEEMFADIKKFFGERPFLCGYNSLRFDEPFLNALYMRCAGEKFTPLLHVDAMKMAKETLDMPSYKLVNVAHELGVDSGITFHKSIDDVIATYRVFSVLQKEYTSPDAEPEKVQLQVKACNYWKGPSYKLERIYFPTAPTPSKTFYDAFKKEWRSDMENIDLEAVKAAAFEMLQVSSEAEMLAKVRENAKQENK